MAEKPQGRTVQPVKVVNTTNIPVVVTPTPNKTSVNFAIVTITDHNQGYQGPDIPVPDGFQLVAALRITQSGAPNGYCAASQANVLVPASRKEVVKGFPLGFMVQNMNELWFGSDTDGCVWELYAEAA